MQEKKAQNAAVSGRKSPTRGKKRRLIVFGVIAAGEIC